MRLSGSRRRRSQPAPTSRSVSRPAHGRCLPAATARTPCIPRRSSGSVAPGSARSLPALTCCTGSGCDGPVAGPARGELTRAHKMFAAMGMDGFAERTGRELLATGTTVGRRAAETHDQLTAQEAQIARLARDGLSNQEIGAQLFLSTRTVEWHLRKVFTKLGVSSRGQLQQALGDRGRPVATA